MSRQPRVFISRTTAGLAALAERVAEALRQRGVKPIIQIDFYPSTHDVKGMLAEHRGLERKTAAQDAPIHHSSFIIHTLCWPVHGLKDPRTKNRLFSYTQLELLIARDLGSPIYTFFIKGCEADDWLTAFAPEPSELAQRHRPSSPSSPRRAGTPTARCKVRMKNAE